MLMNDRNRVMLAVLNSERRGCHPIYCLPREGSIVIVPEKTQIISLIWVDLDHQVSLADVSSPYYVIAPKVRQSSEGAREQIGHVLNAIVKGELTLAG